MCGTCGPNCNCGCLCHVNMSRLYESVNIPQYTPFNIPQMAPMMPMNPMPPISNVGLPTAAATEGARTGYPVHTPMPAQRPPVHAAPSNLVPQATAPQAPTSQHTIGQNGGHTQVPIMMPQQHQHPTMGAQNYPYGATQATPFGSNKQNPVQCISQCFPVKDHYHCQMTCCHSNFS